MKVGSPVILRKLTNFVRQFFLGCKRVLAKIPFQSTRLRLSHPISFLRILPFLFLPTFLHAQSNQTATPHLKLKWGADAESGVPHVFYDPIGGQQLKGFEYEIATQLAKLLNRSLEFYSCNWETLLPGLLRKEYDIILNAIEAGTWGKVASKANIALSVPYYITDVQLVVRKDETHIKVIKDCRFKTIGILKQSGHVEKILSGIEGVQKKIYDDEVKAYADLKYKRLDAVLLDKPEALYYAGFDSDLKLLNENMVRLKYSVMVRAEDKGFLHEIDAAILEMQRNGVLKSILQRWNLWNEETAFYFNDCSPENVTKPIEYENFGKSIKEGEQQRWRFYWHCIPIMAHAAGMTLKLSLVGMALAILMGFSLATLRFYGVAPLRWLITVYVECIRGTPLLIQLLFVFYGMPALAKYLPPYLAEWVCLSPFTAGVLALGINYSAYEAEVYRAGLASVPRSQMEAARALGMTHFQALRHVILPQAVRNVIPPVTNDFITLLQDSSLVSMITITELTKSYQYLAATHFDYFGTGLLVAFMYLLLGFPFVRFARWLEKRMSVGYTRESKPFSKKVI